MNIIPEPLRTQIEEAARASRDMNIANNNDPVDDDNTVKALPDDQQKAKQNRSGTRTRRSS